MINVDLHPKGLTASLNTYGNDCDFITIQITGPNQHVSIFGKPVDRDRFEQIAALLNESFAAVKPATRHHSDPAELAGDYLGAI